MVKEQKLFLMEEKYIGEFKDGIKRMVKEHLLMSHGGKYVGEFKDGLPNGQGTETFSNGRKVYWGVQGWEISWSRNQNMVLMECM